MMEGGTVDDRNVIIVEYFGIGTLEELFMAL